MNPPNLTQTLPQALPGPLLDQGFPVVIWSPPAPPQESLTRPRELLSDHDLNLLVLARHPG